MSTSSSLKDKTILVTGGTGSFGKKFVPLTLDKKNPKKIIVFSRDEMKQWTMAHEFQGDPRLRFFIGDVRDKDRLRRAFEDVDVIIHAAATKIVPTAEYNPFEAVKTNVLGAMNVVDAALDCGVERVIALSTDKASSPVNLYGATKMVSDKVFIAANNYVGMKDTRFSVVRYGNVMGSRGSIIPFFMSLKSGQTLPITDPAMTRFMISLEQGVELVWTAAEEALGGEIFVRKIPSMNVTDIARVVRPDLPTEVVGIRPGEKIHEQMVGPEDAPFTFDYGDHFRILPSIRIASHSAASHNGKLVSPDFAYTSDTNPDWMTDSYLQGWIRENKDLIGSL